jgi:hypothetical protein
VFYYDGWSWYLRRTAALPSIQPVAWGLCIILNIFARSVLFFFYVLKTFKKNYVFNFRRTAALASTQPVTWGHDWWQ